MKSVGIAAAGDPVVPQPLQSPVVRYSLACAGCGATTALAWLLRFYFDPANIVMMFLLTVVLVALRLGRGPAVVAAFLSVALFDFFFVPPQFTLAVNDVQYLLTFAVMLTVGLITGQLTAGLKQSAALASMRERHNRLLYELARELAGALTAQQVQQIVTRFLKQDLHLRMTLLLPDEQDQLVALDARQTDALVPVNRQMTRMSYDNSEELTDLDAEQPVTYFALKTTSRTRGVLAVAPGERSASALEENRDLLQAIASLTATAIERLHYVDVARKAEVDMVAERLRSSTLSALSHDLRTPLTALVGLADSLTRSRQPMLPEQKELAEVIRDQALRISNLVSNLLDMARLNAGRVALRKEWQPLQEVIGSSLKLLGKALADHPTKVTLPPDLPLIQFDAVLMERVFCNLLENAAKFSPHGSPIEITARCAGAVIEVQVCDRGPGIPETDRGDIFEMFVRGKRESTQPGVGLGLAICRAVIEAHSGTIGAANRPEGGACFVFTLPCGSPPEVEPELPGESAQHE